MPRSQSQGLLVESAVILCSWILLFFSVETLAVDQVVPEIVRQHPSVKNSEWLRADFFLRANLSDQAIDVSEIVERAKLRGLRVVAVLDDQALKSESRAKAYSTAILAARQAHPEMVIFSGLNWKVSPRGSSEDLTILVPIGPDEFQIIREFQSQFCNSSVLSDSPDVVLQSFQWLKQQASRTSKPVVLSHSTRWLGESSGGIVKTLESLLRDKDLVVGFPIIAPLEGGVRLETVEQQLRAENVREQAWNQLMVRGHHVHSAFSHSWTFNQDADQSSGDLAETWISIPKEPIQEDVSDRVLDALRRGYFFTSQLGVVKKVRFSVSIDGLEREVFAGEEVVVAAGTFVRIMLECEIPREDLEGNSNWLDSIEFTSVSNDGVEKISENSLQVGAARFEWRMRVPEGGVALRGGGHRAGDDGGRRHFYTNFIRIRAEPRGDVWSANDSLSPTFLYPLLKYLGAAVIGLVVVLFSLRLFLQQKRRRRSIAVDLLPRPLSVGQPDVSQASAVDWKPPVVNETSSVQDEREKKVQDDLDTHHRAVLAIPTRSHFALGAVVVTAFAVYGLYVPLNYEAIPWRDALKEFSEIPFLQIGVQRRQDWVANILLFVPLGFLWCAALILDTRNLFAKIIFAVIVVIGLSGLAVVTEFFQLWYPPRTVSQNDIIAESLGALIGSVLALLSIQWIVDWFRNALKQATLKGVLDWMLRLYFVAILFITLMPFDFVLNSNELRMKSEAGRLSMEFPAWTALSVANMIATAIMFVPMGIWVARPHHSRRRIGLIGEVAISIGIVAVFELMQIPVYSRFTTLSGFLAGAVGAVFGVFSAKFLGEKVESVLLAVPQQNPSRSLKSLFFGMSYIIVLAFFYVGPRNLESVGEAIQRLRDFWQVPFARLYWGTELNAFFVIVRQLALLFPLGFLLSDFVLFRGSEHKFKFRLAFCVVVISCIATLIEVGQVWNVDRYSDVTDSLLLAIGGLGGVVLRASLADWSNFGFSTQKGRLVTPNRVLAWALLGAFCLLGTGLASYRVVHTVLGSLRPMERRVDLVVEDEATSNRLRVQRVIVPTLDTTEVIWGATGSDRSGSVWFGVSGDSNQFNSARVYQISTSEGWLTEVGSILPELQKQGLLREGESQQKIHSKFVEAGDGYVYFTSMDETGEASDGSRLPIWGSHLWRVHPSHPDIEHLAAVPEGLIAVSGGGEWIYCLGLFDHVLYQWNVRAKELKKVRVGSVGGHVSRNLVSDHRGHAFVPRIKDFGDPHKSPENPSKKTPGVIVELVEFNTMLREIGRTKLENYFTDSYWTNHGIVGFSNLADNSCVFVTSQGYLYRVLSQSGDGAASVLPLGWIHPDGEAYAASLFELNNGHSVGSVVKRADEFEWVEFDLRTRRSDVFQFPIPSSITSVKDLLLYGSQTRDPFGAFYVVGKVHSTPVMLRVETR